MQYTPDGRFSPCFLSHNFKKAGETEPDELFYRYYLRLKAGYQCSVQPKKLPGLAGRYPPNDSGNGGNPSTGRMGTDGLSGWSARNLRTGRRPAPDWMIPIGTYLYQADMKADFGDNALGCPWLVADQDYCIEQYVKMNTHRHERA